MRDFIQRLYELENFPVYLGIIIVILLIIFIIVYFLGKKDSSKLEATQRIDKITDDAFKETSVTEQVEVSASEPVNQINPFLTNQKPSEMTYPSIPIRVPEPDLRAPEIEYEMKAPEIEMDIKAPEIEYEMSAPEIEYEMKAPEIEEPMMYAPEISVEAPVIEVEEPRIEAPIISIEEDAVENKIDRFNELANSIEQELNALERKPLFEDKEEPILPELKKEDTKKIDVFSSVYGPKKEVELTNDTTEIELPKLK